MSPSAAPRDPASTIEARLAALEARVARDEARAEAERAIRACVNRYMVLCDALDARTPLDELAGLFTRDAVWEGRGARYAKSFGGHHGREAIAAMFRRYMGEPAHFALNVHFLCSELIEVDAPEANTASTAAVAASIGAEAEEVGPTSARASWVMLQTSTFASGDSHLNAARLTLRMAVEEGAWRIAHFQTENLFSRPVSAWQDVAPLPVPAAEGRQAAVVTSGGAAADVSPGRAAGQANPLPADTSTPARPDAATPR